MVEVSYGPTVRCDHGYHIRIGGVKQPDPQCGCYEVEICLGCGKEDCTGCPCGTSLRVKRKNNSR